MPPPFPGMDPYLEHLTIWPDFHHEWISAAREAMNQQILPRYVARVEQRVFISDEDDPGRRVLIPDIQVDTRAAGETSTATRQGTTAIAEPIVLPELIDEELHESRIEIIERASGTLVTVIELVSPSNKIPGASARESFLRKRREILGSDVHWVEVDLLRGGATTSAFRQGMPRHDYAAYTAKWRPGGSRLRLFWPIGLEQGLPTIAVPLRHEDADASLDLQALLNVAYDRAGYAYQIDYRGAVPEPPLAGERVAWVGEIVANVEPPPDVGNA